MLLELLALLILFSCGIIRADETFHRLIITGGLKGAVKECHCPNGQPGGLARRQTIIQQLRSESPAQTTVLDCGRLTRDGEEPLEAVLLGELICLMPYNFICCYLVDFHQIFFNEICRSDNPAKIPLYKEMNNRMTIKDILKKGSNKWPFGCIFRDSSSTEALLQRYNYYTGLGSVLQMCPAIVFHVQTAWFEREDVKDNLVDSLSRFYHCGPQRETDPWPKAFEAEGLTVNIRNLRDMDDFLGPVQELDVCGADLTNLDVAIFGGGGYLEPEVFTVNHLITAHPDDFGAFVLALDLWTKDGRTISRFEWEAVPSDGVPPDTAFQRRINAVYEQLNRK